MPKFRNTPSVPSSFLHLHLHPHEDGTDSVPKRRHIKFRRRGITQKKAYNIQNMEKVWNKESSIYFRINLKRHFYIYIYIKHNSMPLWIAVIFTSIMTPIRPLLSRNMATLPFQWINQQDAAISQVYCLSFKYSSTCFGRPHARHQELQQLQ